jgi:hypothetical protein
VAVLRLDAAVLVLHDELAATALRSGAGRWRRRAIDALFKVGSLIAIWGVAVGAMAIRQPREPVGSTW